MNVAFDSWIPIVTITGERKPASLSEVFSNGEHYADLAVRPHERVADAALSVRRSCST